MSFPSYPRYKYSGVKWLGEVPEHWQIVRIRHLCECLDGKRIPLNAAERAERLGDVPYWGANAIVGYVDEPLFDEDLVLLGEDGAPFFDPTKPVAFFIQGKVWANNHVHVLRPNVAGAGKFIANALNATDYSQFVDGSTRDKLTQSAMNDIPLPWPTTNEQNAIVAFLARETAKIDALISEQRRLIELLKEKRQAVISQSVTQGLDPHVQMKPSGVEWLGDVPAHWEVTRLANVFREVVESGAEELPVLSVSIHQGVSDKELEEDEMERKVTRSEDRSKYKRVAPSDLVYNMMRAWQGGFGTVTVEGMVSPAYVVARPRMLIPTSFIEHLLRIPQAVEQMRRHSRGVTDFRLRLYWDEFRNIRIVLPPRSEASAICEAIASLNERFSALSAVAEESIALLQERRKALIFAAVTGKIDIRGLAEMA